MPRLPGRLAVAAIVAVVAGMVAQPVPAVADQPLADPSRATGDGAPDDRTTARSTESTVEQTSKLGKEQVRARTRGWHRGKNKLCCGYPLSEERGFKYTFYWMADEHRHSDTQRWRALPDQVLDIQGVGVDNVLVDLYTREGHFLATVLESFANELKMEGSGWLADGRVINYAGRCKMGVGTCFEVLDPTTHPFGRGARRRPLVPFRSVAVDRRLIPIGETLYAPEFDGLLLPDGTIHDGCLRADDTGGAIKQRLIDFYVLELENFLWVNQRMWADRYFTPHIEDPRCDYLRDER